jgi:NADH/NAD ratio-sensing transcriptional regulator Rex
MTSEEKQKKINKEIQARLEKYNKEAEKLQKEEVKKTKSKTKKDEESSLD